MKRGSYSSGENISYWRHDCLQYRLEAAMAATMRLGGTIISSPGCMLKMAAGFCVAKSLQLMHDM